LKGKGKKKKDALFPDLMWWYKASTPLSPSRAESSQILLWFGFSWFSPLKVRIPQGCHPISYNSAPSPKTSLNQHLWSTAEWAAYCHLPPVVSLNAQLIKCSGVANCLKMLRLLIHPPLLSLRC